MTSFWLHSSRNADSADWLQGKSWHDVIWLTVPVLAILLTAPAWFFRLVDLDMGSLTWSLFTFTLVRELVNYWNTRLKDHADVLAITLAGDYLGICLLGLLWHYSQTISNPLFLLVLLVPVIAGALVYSSAITYSLAAAAIFTVSIVAWIDVPSLRNTFLQTALIPGWLAASISMSGSDMPANLTSENSAAGSISILLAFVFGSIIVASIADRLCVHFGGMLKARVEIEQAHVPEDRRPTFSVNRLNLAITSANKAFRDYCLSDATPATLALADGSAEATILSGPSLFDCIHFDEELEIRRIIASQGGSTLCHYSVGPEARVGRIHISVIENGEQCEMKLEDLSAELYLRTTLETLDHGVIMLAENRIVLYFNNAARRLFPLLVNGVEASRALQVETLGSPWWELGERAHHNRTLNINGRKYHTACTAAQLPRQDVPISVLSLSEA